MRAAPRSARIIGIPHPPGYPVYFIAACGVGLAARGFSLGGWREIWRQGGGASGGLGAPAPAAGRAFHGHQGHGARAASGAR